MNVLQFACYVWLILCLCLSFCKTCRCLVLYPIFISKHFRGNTCSFLSMAVRTIAILSLRPNRLTIVEINDLVLLQNRKNSYLAKFQYLILRSTYDIWLYRSSFEVVINHSTDSRKLSNINLLTFRVVKFPIIDWILRQQQQQQKTSFLSTKK